MILVMISLVEIARWFGVHFVKSRLRIANLSFLLSFQVFLEASKHFYVKICPSVDPLIDPSVGQSVHFFSLSKSF